MRRPPTSAYEELKRVHSVYSELLAQSNGRLLQLTTGTKPVSEAVLDSLTGQIDRYERIVGETAKELEKVEAKS